MPKSNFYKILQQELKRIDSASTDKRHERVIEGFTSDPSPRAIIKGKQYLLFNSNDYLGLRFNSSVQKAEEQAAKTYGTSPGAVRFISGTEKVYIDLENEIASFHQQEGAIVFSSAFAANVGVIHALIKGQAKDSAVSDSTLVVSDELNHRSIIDGIRVANLPKEQRAIYKHLDAQDLSKILEDNKGKYQRVLVITDGIFSMLGEYAVLDQLKKVIDSFDEAYEQGILLVVDDSHGVGAFGQKGRGTEEVTHTQADILIGTFGKAFGADGGYAVANQAIIDYLRESAATYIYSNSVSPGVAGAALAAVKFVSSPEGTALLNRLDNNVQVFKSKIKEAGFTLASDSIHPIQPLLIGDAAKTKQLTELLFENGYIVTNINYPVVPPGKDEIRVQISASHTEDDIENFINKCSEIGSQLGLIS